MLKILRATCASLKQPYLFARCKWVLCWWLFASGHPKSQKRAELLWRGKQEPLLKWPLSLSPCWPAPWLQPGQIDPHGSSLAKQTWTIHTHTHTQREMCTRRCGTGESVPAIVPLTLLHAVPPGKGNPLVSLFLF